VVDNHFSQDNKERIANYWKQEFGMPVKVEIVNEIPILQNNKRKIIIIE